MRLTTGCAKLGHREFELETGTLPAFLVEHLVRFIESRVAEGARFEVGQHVLMGSQLLRVGAAGDHLTMLERVPHSADDWERGVARTMMAMYRQRCCNESVGMLDRLTFPKPTAFAMVCKRVEEAAAVVFVRQHNDDDDSGWAVLCGDDDHDHDDADELLATTVQTVSERVPLFHVFVAMPPGTLVVRAGTKIVAFDFQRESLRIQPGSFLDKLREQEGWDI